MNPILILEKIENTQHVSKNQSVLMKNAAHLHAKPKQIEKLPENYIINGSELSDKNYFKLKKNVESVYDNSKRANAINLQNNTQFEFTKTSDETLQSVTASSTKPHQNPIYCFHHPDSEMHIFQSMDTVLTRLDLQKGQIDPLNFHNSSCDLLWASHLHHIERVINWPEIGYFRKVNHIPGNFHLTSKSIFGRNTDSPYVPKTFTDSRSLREYAIKFPNKKFVLKLKSNRGIKLVNVSNLEFDENPNDLNGYFVQEFIDNPLLFDGHKFDFGIFVAVTSVRPLRFYYYTKNMIMRFCSQTYSTDNVDHVDRYVIGDTIIPVWEFNGTKRYLENGYTTRDAFEGFLEDIGADVTKIWREIENAIRSIIVGKERKFGTMLDILKSTTFNHFELFRFDMMLDSNLNLHVIEINQHPNLYPGPPHVPNKHLYENLLYNLFTLIGVGTNYRKNQLKFPSIDIEMMIGHPNSLRIKPKLCISEICQRSCDGTCEICWQCQNVDQKYSKLLAYMEQMNVGEFKRLFPAGSEESLLHNVSVESKSHAEWFVEMCKKNKKFC